MVSWPDSPKIWKVERHDNTKYSVQTSLTANLQPRVESQAMAGNVPSIDVDYAKAPTDDQIPAKPSQKPRPCAAPGEEGEVAVSQAHEDIAGGRISGAIYQEENFACGDICRASENDSIQWTKSRKNIFLVAMQNGNIFILLSPASSVRGVRLWCNMVRS